MLTNADFERMLDTSDTWIRERTGIRERHIAGPNDTTSGMGSEAARLALAEAGSLVYHRSLLDPAELVATSLTIGIGGSGGVFAPSLYIGGMLGTSVAPPVHFISPWSASAP